MKPGHEPLSFSRQGQDGVRRRGSRLVETRFDAELSSKLASLATCGFLVVSKTSPMKIEFAPARKHSA